MIGLRGWNVAVLAAAFGLWLASGTQKEKPVLSQAKSEAVRTLEEGVAARPADAAEVKKLAQAYLDSQASGLSVSVIESSPTNVKSDVQVEHVYARALVAQGRNQDALAAEKRVLARCAAGASCDGFLLASATRRADILEELVRIGVEDSAAEPEASAIAYHNASREARVAQ
jgi:methylthioribose-1-phosphate isomerase